MGFRCVGDHGYFVREQGWACQEVCQKLALAFRSSHKGSQKVSTLGVEASSFGPHHLISNPDERDFRFRRRRSEAQACDGCEEKAVVHLFGAGSFAPQDRAEAGGVKPGGRAFPAFLFVCF